MKRLYLVLFILVLSLTLVACVDSGDDSEDVTLNVAINFDGNKFISYNKDEPYVGMDGITYSKGDLLPVWRQIGINLGINFVDKGMELEKANTNTQFEDAVTDGFAGIDIINSTGANITANRDSFVNLKPHLDSGKMPNLRSFLDSQPTYEPYLTAVDGGMYYTPYLDGNGEIELGFLMRLDWTEKILDTEVLGDNTSAKGALVNTERFNPATLDTTLTVATAGAKTRQVSVKYSKNIIDILKDLDNPTGNDYLQAFRTYMNDVHGDDYEKLSDVFVGLDSGYLTDELVALMAVVKSNPQMLRGKDDVTVYFPREAKGSRVRNLFRGLEMYGVRGAVSKNNWLYIDAEGKLHDARHEESTLDALGRLNALYEDKLILQGFDNGGTDITWRDVLLNDADGFLIYDYNATQTAQGTIDKAKAIQEDYRFEMILPPVNDWRGDGKYFHFTESVRMLKNEAWGITKEAAKDPKKLAKAIELFDYLYDEEEGANLHLFGPKAWRSDEQFDYAGTMIPKFKDEVLQEIIDLKGGNMVNYLREYLGATQPIGHVRSLGLELQTVSEQGMSGFLRLRNAADAGVLELLGLSGGDDTWYYPVPNVFPLTTAQENRLKTTKAAFDNYWKDAELYKIVQQGLSETYMDLFKYEGKDWYEEFIGFYTEALPK